jgi:hypothetical protein
MKNSLVLLAALASLAGCGGGSSGSAPPPPPPPAPPPVGIDMDQVLDDFIAGNANVSSLAMLAVRDGEIV